MKINHKLWAALCEVNLRACASVYAEAVHGPAKEEKLAARNLKNAAEVYTWAKAQAKAKKP